MPTIVRIQHSLLNKFLGVMFVHYAYKLFRVYSDELARKLFRFSILYLSLLFAALLADHWLIMVPR